MLVSAVITAFNAEKHIFETLTSVCGQSYKPMEVIVVDDGSTDGTADIVRTHFPSVRYIYQANAGQPAARNTGIRCSGGEYIAFIDSDDLWFPDKIARQISQLTETKTAWCYCDCVYFLETPEHTLYRFSAQVRPRQGQALEPLLLGNFICSPTPVVRQDLLIDAGLWDEGVLIAEDWNMWLRLAARFPVAYVDEPLAAYRVHANSMMRTASIPQLLEANLAVLSNGLKLSHKGTDRRFIAKTHANIYFKVGLTYLKNGKENTGRRMIFKALQNDPTQYRFYFYQITSLFPSSFVRTANRLRHWFFRVAKPIS